VLSQNPDRVESTAGRAAPAWPAPAALGILSREVTRPLPRLALAAALCLAAGCGRGRAVVVSAAVSLKEPLEELGGRFERAGRGRVELNLGGSGALARQAIAGAPVDVLVTASDRHMDEVERAGLVAAGTRRAIAGNVLVVVTPEGAAPLTRVEQLGEARIARVAVGNPRTVPAGAYAEQWLRGLGLWDRLAPRLVYTENVRPALEYVARGEADAAIVYTTDARRRPVREAVRAGPGAHDPIRYPAAVLRGAARPAAARAFLDFVAGPDGQAVLARHGFQPAR
jgi:molybdate transport system substrate-binding protein